MCDDDATHLHYAIGMILYSLPLPTYITLLIIICFTAPLIIRLVDAFPEVMKVFAVGFVRSLMGGGLDHKHAKVSSNG